MFRQCQIMSYLFNIPAKKISSVFCAVIVTSHCIIQFSPIPRCDA